LGAFYSFGITFNKLEDAEFCKLSFENYDLQLSDSTIVDSRIFTRECDYLLNDKKQFICVIFPRGLELPNENPKLLQAKYFYEIRDLLYKFLIQIKLEFNIAFFEFEGADFIQDNSPLMEIEDYDNYYVGLNEYFGDSQDFIQKKYLGGLVISTSVIKANPLNFNGFEIFKIGYSWIPF
jgi:hypothetical protein